MAKRLRIDRLSQVPTLVLSAVAIALIKAGDWVLKIDEAHVDFEEAFPPPLDE